MYNNVKIRIGHVVDVNSENGMYSAKIIGIAKNHYRLQTYFLLNLPAKHNVLKAAVTLHDGQY